VIFVLAAGCGRNPAAPDSEITSPAWLTAVIRQLETQPVANPPAFIARYEYKGDTVYFVPQRCCDVMSVVFGSDGAVMCHPDGGFAGTGDGRCPDFFAARRSERIIWRDPRIVAGVGILRTASLHTTTHTGTSPGGMVESESCDRGFIPDLGQVASDAVPRS
jgi:hypothetical protein